MLIRVSWDYASICEFNSLFNDSPQWDIPKTSHGEPFVMLFQETEKSIQWLKALNAHKPAFIWDAEITFMPVLSNLTRGQRFLVAAGILSRSFWHLLKLSTNLDMIWEVCWYDSAKEWNELYDRQGQTPSLNHSKLLLRTGNELSCLRIWSTKYCTGPLPSRREIFFATIVRPPKWHVLSLPARTHCPRVRSEKGMRWFFCVVYRNFIEMVNASLGLSNREVSRSTARYILCWFRKNGNGSIHLHRVTKQQWFLAIRTSYLQAKWKYLRPWKCGGRKGSLPCLHQKSNNFREGWGPAWCLSFFRALISGSLFPWAKALCPICVINIGDK